MKVGITREPLILTPPTRATQSRYYVLYALHLCIPWFSTSIRYKFLTSYSCFKKSRQKIMLCLPPASFYRSSSDFYPSVQILSALFSPPSLSFSTHAIYTVVYDFDRGGTYCTGASIDTQFKSMCRNTAPRYSVKGHTAEAYFVNLRN